MAAKAQRKKINILLKFKEMTWCKRQEQNQEILTANHLFQSLPTICHVHVIIMSTSTAPEPLLSPKYITVFNSSGNYIRFKCVTTAAIGITLNLPLCNQKRKLRFISHIGSYIFLQLQVYLPSDL